MEFADQAIAAAVRPGAAGAGADGVSGDVDGTGALEYLDGGVEGVGHVGLHGREAVELRSGPHAAAEGLVVVPARAAHGQVVHRPLAGGGNALRQGLGQGAHDHVHHPAAGLHVAGGHGGRAAGVEQAALGGVQGDGAEAAGTGGGVGRHQAAEHVVDGRRRHRQRAVDVAGHLSGGAGEVGVDGMAIHAQGQFDGDVGVTEAVVVHHVAKAVFAVGNGVQGGAGQALAVGVEFPQGLGKAGFAEADHQFREPPEAGAVGADLGGEVAAAFLAAQTGKDVIEHGFVRLAGLHQPGRRNDQALLRQRARQRHGAGRVAADVGMMGAIGDEGLQPAVVEQGRHHGHVGQVGAAEIGIVEDDHVPFLPVDAGHDPGHGVGHAPQVHGNVGRLGAETAFGVEHGAGEVEPFANVGGEGRALQHRAHLVADGGQAAGEDPQFDDIHGAAVYPKPGAAALFDQNSGLL